MRKHSCIGLCKLFQGQLMSIRVMEGQNSVEDLNLRLSGVLRQCRLIKDFKLIISSHIQETMLLATAIR